MRIPSGKTDQNIYFVGYDSADHTTRKTGLSSFTVYRSRNGAAEVAYTTPTISEIDSTNMPGVYALLVDEDTTIASGSDSEEYCVHITCSGMDPVTRSIELYRRDTTSGRTLDVSSGGEAGLDWANIGSPTTTVALSGTTVKTATDVETDTQDIQSRLPAALVSGRIDASVGAMASDVLTDTALAASAVTEIQSGLSTLDAADVRTAVGLASANLDTQLAAIDDYIDTEVAAIKAKTDNLPDDPADASVIAGRFDTVDTSLSTIAGYIDTEVAAIKAKTDNLPASPAATGDIPTSDITAIKNKTDSLTFTVAGQVDSNIQSVNDVTVTGTGASGDEWGP